MQVEQSYVHVRGSTATHHRPEFLSSSHVEQLDGLAALFLEERQQESETTTAHRCRQRRRAAVVGETLDQHVKLPSLEIHAPPWLDGKFHSALKPGPSHADDVLVIRVVIDADVSRELDVAPARDPANTYTS